MSVSVSLCAALRETVAAGVHSFHCLSREQRADCCLDLEEMHLSESVKDCITGFCHGSRSDGDFVVLQDFQGGSLE